MFGYVGCDEFALDLHDVSCTFLQDNGVLVVIFKSGHVERFNMHHNDALEIIKAHASFIKLGRK